MGDKGKEVLKKKRKKKEVNEMTSISLKKKEINAQF